LLFRRPGFLGAFVESVLSKQILLGPLLGNNRSQLIRRCADLISAGESDSFLYLAASHPLLDLASEQILEGSTNKGIWGELPVHLFRGLVRRILSTALDTETGQLLQPLVPIDREELPLKRSIVSQLLKRLVDENKLRAIGPLATREGCINTIVALIGELQRAATTPAEFAAIVQKRLEEHGENSDESADRKQSTIRSQVDFDRDVALVYSTYCDLLDKNKLTESDADQLRALAILRGELDGRRVEVPWLANTKLLVLDGFFDFTPVQGEILRELIPQIPDVIVNLNNDEKNPEIFRAFDETIGQLKSMAKFKVEYSSELEMVRGALAPLRVKLFNPSLRTSTESADQPQSQITYLECADRETEIRAIAKEIKKLVLVEDYRLADIALIVRERAAYADTVLRVMEHESVPCNLTRRIDAGQIPAARAALKLFAVLEELARDKTNVLKMPALADQIKSGYFRLSDEQIENITTEFQDKFRHLLSEGASNGADDERHMRRLGIGIWDADALENVIAYVGSELRLTDWLDRCRKLVDQLPTAEATKELLNIETAEPVSEDDDTQIEGAETVQPEDKHLEKKRRPQRDIHPAAIAWSALVIKHFGAQIQSMPQEGSPADLRVALMKLLDAFQFRDQVMRPTLDTDDAEISRATLDLNALESVRRALLAAIKSIELTKRPGNPKTKLVTFLEEVRRSLGSQTITVSNVERGGLRVLEATDVRGLKFRAIFIAGLIEGGFPLSAVRDWIYPHEERERLKRYGLTLEDISPTTLLKEEHYFYQAACRATERLYLTRPLLLEGETETVASYYIDEVQRAIAPAAIIKRDVVRPDYDGSKLKDASSGAELAVALVRQEQRIINSQDRSGLVPSAQLQHLLALALSDKLVSTSALRRIAIERERAGTSFGPYDGQITNVELLKILNQRFNSDFVHSASGLGTFGSCAFRFFAQRVLKLEPRGEAALDLQALDAGKLLHDILRRFFEKHRGERLQLAQRDQLSSELLKIADDVFDLHEHVVPPLNKQIWKLDREIRKIILEQVLLFELDLQEKSSSAGVTPRHFELAFGGTKSAARDPDSVEEPLRLTRSTATGEETMKISGQIDRVDIADDNTLIAYDYKLSKGAPKRDIANGRSLQIPIYLEALEQLFFPGHAVAGGGYYTLRGGTERRNTGMYRAEFNDYLSLYPRLASICGEHEWQQFRSEVKDRIWNFFDRMRAGRFTVEPSEGYKTCRFCDYTTVCRYDKYRIERKRLSLE
jgi:ATP-dependent helicase/DNAse subunit B